MKQRWSHNLYTQNTYIIVQRQYNAINEEESKEKPRCATKFLRNRWWSRSCGDYQRQGAGETTIQEKTPRGYKKPRKQLQAPSRKISSEPSSESSEYDEESESDDDKKGLLIDISRKGRKMAATSSNRGRREWKIIDDDNIDDDNTKKSSPGLAITLR